PDFRRIASAATRRIDATGRGVAAGERTRRPSRSADYFGGGGAAQWSSDHLRARAYQFGESVRGATGTVTLSAGNLHQDAYHDPATAGAAQISNLARDPRELAGSLDREERTNRVAADFSIEKDWCAS